MSGGLVAPTPQGRLSGRRALRPRGSGGGHYPDSVGSPRSWLYVPGDRPDRLASAAKRGADALIADLEDSVRADAKDAARANVSRWLTDRPGGQLWVRVNADSITEDVAAVAVPTLSGIVVPKADPDLLRAANAALDEQERRRGLPSGRFSIFALLETARGLLAASSVAAAARVRHVGMGEADLIGELRLQPSADREELQSLRLQVVVACAAVGAGPPTGPTSTNLSDPAGLRRSTVALLRLGFRSRTAVHPNQLPVINEVFTPTGAEVAEARALLERFGGSGGGVFTDERGRMVDAAVVRSAHEVLGRAERTAGE